jgi:predicted Zn-dependent peptidase
VSRADRSRLPDVHLPKALHFPAFYRTRLVNGLAIRTATRRGLPLVALIVVLPVGAAADPGDLPGLAALTGDLLDEGTGDRSAIEIHEEIAGMGGELEIDVGADATTLALTLLSEHFDRGVRLLGDLVIRPRLDETDVDRVRTLRLDRLAQLRGMPSAIADRAFLHVLYGMHPYGHAAIGTEKALGRVRADDVRAFHATRYTPHETTMVAAGDVDEAQVSSAVASAFDEWTAEAPAADADRGHGGVPGNVSASLGVIDRPGAAQSELRIGHVGPPRATPDYHALLVLNALLGGQFVSRINLNLRERKGYTYGARTTFDFRKGPGPFLLQTSVDTRATADAVREAIGEIAGVRGERPVTPQELDLARASLTRGYARSFETVGQIARGAAQLALYDLPDNYFEQFVPSVLRVGVDEVTRAAVEHIDPGRLVTLVVGDAAVVIPALREAGFGEPALLQAE